MHIDGLTFGFEIVNFLVLVWLLTRFLFRPVARALAGRRRLIDEAFAKAAAEQAAADAARREYEGRLEAWQREKAALRKDELALLDAERSKRLASLHAELDRERELAQSVAERRADDLRREYERAARTEAAGFAAQFLARLASPAMAKSLLRVACEDLLRLPEASATVADALRAAGRRVQLESAAPLDADELRELGDALARVAGGPVEIACAPAQPALVCGLRMTIGAVLLEANVRDELRFFFGGARHGG
jgi:F-type H+-transporting ATPase subunit b